MSARSSARARCRSSSASRSRSAPWRGASMPRTCRPRSGGGGLDFVSATLMDRELGKSTWGLVGWVGRPSEILNACRDDQREAYLLPTVTRRAQGGLRPDRAQRRLGCHGHPDPSPARTATTTSSTAASISSAAWPARLRHPLHRHRGRARRRSGPRKQITAFLVDCDTPGASSIRRGPRSVATAPITTTSCSFSDCRVPARNILGEEGRGFEQAGQWLANTRILVAANCCGKAERAMEIATQLGGDPQAIRPDHRQVPGRQLQAGRHGDRAARRRPADRPCRPGNTPAAP